MVLDIYFTNDYIRALVIFIGLLIILRIFMSILTRVILRLVRKTKTKLDDIIIQKSSIPITIILLLASLKIALM